MKRPGREAFGTYLRERRTRLQRSQQSVAGEVGVSLTYYNKLERGTADPPSAETLDKLVEALGAERDTLYDLAGKIPDEVLEAVRAHPEQWPTIRGWLHSKEGSRQ